MMEREKKKTFGFGCCCWLWIALARNWFERFIYLIGSGWLLLNHPQTLFDLDGHQRSKVSSNIETIERSMDYFIKTENNRFPSADGWSEKSVIIFSKHELDAINALRHNRCFSAFDQTPAKRFEGMRSASLWRLKVKQTHRYHQRVGVFDGCQMVLYDWWPSVELSKFEGSP